MIQFVHLFTVHQLILDLFLHLLFPSMDIKLTTDRQIIKLRIEHDILDIKRGLRSLTPMQLSGTSLFRGRNTRLDKAPW